MIREVWVRVRGRPLSVGLAIGLTSGFLATGVTAQSPGPGDLASPVPVSSAGASASLVPSVPVLAWQRLDKLPVKKTGVRTSVTDEAGNVVLLAVTVENGTPAYTWRSADGRKYKSGEIPNGDVPDFLLRAGDDILAVDRSAGPNGTQVWRSSDDIKWKAQKQGLPGAPTIGGAGSSSAGVVLAGMNDQVPSAWTSIDGRTWARADLPFSGQPYDAYPNFAAVSPAGLWVAGTYGRGTSVGPLLWTSTDGTTWQAATLPVDATDHLIDAITSTPAGVLLVTVGTAADGTWTSTFWSSADGVTWQQVFDVPGDVVRISSASTASTSGAPAVVAFAADQLLVSPDGISWSAQPLPPLAHGERPFTAAVAGDGSVIVAAATTDDYGSPKAGSIYRGTAAP
jgi:hypothetical protein